MGKLICGLMWASHSKHLEKLTMSRLCSNCSSDICKNKIKEAKINSLLASRNHRLNALHNLTNERPPMQLQQRVWMANYPAKYHLFFIILPFYLIEPFHSICSQWSKSISSSSGSFFCNPKSQQTLWFGFSFSCTPCRIGPVMERMEWPKFVLQWSSNNIYRMVHVWVWVYSCTYCRCTAWRTICSLVFRGGGWIYM